MILGVWYLLKAVLPAQGKGQASTTKNAHGLVLLRFPTFNFFGDWLFFLKIRSPEGKCTGRGAEEGGEREENKNVIFFFFFFFRTLFFNLQKYKEIQFVTQLWEAERLGRKEQLQYNLSCAQHLRPERPQWCVQSKLFTTSPSSLRGHRGELHCLNQGGKKPVLCLLSPDATPSHVCQVLPCLMIDVEGMGGVPSMPYTL